jgi:ADP-ribose pyrophosphatase YjhB (NUDIX family)
MMENYFTGQVTQKILLFYRDSFVIVKEKGQDIWILPGGRVNAGETLEDGLKREVMEELGVSCSIGKILNADISLATAYEPKLFLFYMGSAPDEQELTINNEITDFFLISKKEELVDYPMFDNQKAILERVLL